MGFEATTNEAPQKLKELVESYFLIKDQDDEVERFKGEDFMTTRRCIQYW